MTKYLLLFFISISCFFACQNGQEKSSQEQARPSMDVVVEQTKQAKKFVSVIGGLRVRDMPSAEGEVLWKLSYGQEVIDLEEESDHKERIELRDKMRYDSWKKIRLYEGTKDETDGWAFGGGLLSYSAIYKVTSSDTIERKIVGATKDELSSMLNLKIGRDLFYDGIIRYLKSDSGELVRNGAFKVEGMRIEELENYPFEFRSSISGNYKAGKRHGLFRKSESVYEFSELILINFENGECVWTSTTISSEGEDETTRDDNPTECGF